MALESNFAAGEIGTTDNTLVIGTVQVATATGIADVHVRKCSVDHSVDLNVIKSMMGGVRAVLLQNATVKMTLDLLWDSAIEVPSIGDAVEIPELGVTGICHGQAGDWEEGKERGITLTVTAFNDLLTFSMYDTTDGTTFGAAIYTIS